MSNIIQETSDADALVFELSNLLFSMNQREPDDILDFHINLIEDLRSYLKEKNNKAWNELWKACRKPKNRP